MTDCGFDLSCLQKLMVKREFSDSHNYLTVEDKRVEMLAFWGASHGPAS